MLRRACAVCRACIVLWLCPGRLSVLHVDKALAVCLDSILYLYRTSSCFFSGLLVGCLVCNHVIFSR